MRADQLLRLLAVEQTFYDGLSATGKMQFLSFRQLNRTMTEPFDQMTGDWRHLHENRDNDEQYRLETFWMQNATNAHFHRMLQHAGPRPARQGSAGWR